MRSSLASWGSTLAGMLLLAGCGDDQMARSCVADTTAVLWTVSGAVRFTDRELLLGEPPLDVSDGFSACDDFTLLEGDGYPHNTVHCTTASEGTWILGLGGNLTPPVDEPMTEALEDAGEATLSMSSGCLANYRSSARRVVETQAVGVVDPPGGSVPDDFFRARELQLTFTRQHSENERECSPELAPETIAFTLDLEVAAPQAAPDGGTCGQGE